MKEIKLELSKFKNTKRDPICMWGPIEILKDTIVKKEIKLAEYYANEEECKKMDEIVNPHYDRESVLEHNIYSLGVAIKILEELNKPLGSL